MLLDLGSPQGLVALHRPHALIARPKLAMYHAISLVQIGQDIALIIDVERHQVLSPELRLTPKWFSLFVFLALRRTDGSSGWVELEEIRQRVPEWRSEPRSAASAMGRLNANSWFPACVAFKQVTVGPYRLKDSPEFLPSRDAANRFLNQRAAELGVGRSTGGRAIGIAELTAYDHLVQSGVYMPTMVDLVLQRIGTPETIRSLDERILATRILATLAKNRGQEKDSIELSKRGRMLAARVGRLEDEAYFIDQMGGAYYLLGDLDAAERCFREEIALLEPESEGRGAFGMVAAYRGLAATLRQRGRTEEARTAILLSSDIARRCGNEEGERLSHIERRRLGLPADPLLAIPAGHVVGRVMALVDEAIAAANDGDLERAGRLASLAFSDARQFGLLGQVGRLQGLLTSLKFNASKFFPGR